MDLRDTDIRYIVSTGCYKSEGLALERLKVTRESGLKSELIDVKNDPRANLEAALLLIAEQVKSNTEAIKKLTEKLGAAPVIEETPAPEPKTKPDNKLGEFLRARRESLGLSRQNVGDLLATSYKNIARWEDGLSRPRADSLFNLCGALNISTDEIREYI